MINVPHIDTKWGDKISRRNNNEDIKEPGAEVNEEPK
jgi:hypothetical protein